MQTRATSPFPAPLISSIGTQLRLIPVEVVFFLDTFLGISSGTKEKGYKTFEGIINIALFIQRMKLQEVLVLLLRSVMKSRSIQDSYFIW